MGQYYYVANTTKKEYLHPHKFGDGLKLLEFGSSGGGTMLGLAVLLADGNGRGGGDLRVNTKAHEKWVGRWKNDRIVITGDYADNLPGQEQNLYSTIGEDKEWKDVSDQVLVVMCDDEYVRQDLANSMAWRFRVDRKPKKLFDRLYPDGKVPDPYHSTPDAKALARAVLNDDCDIQILMDKLVEDGAISLDHLIPRVGV